MKSKKSIVIIGGPIEQKIDPVLILKPSGQGKLASAIADEFENKGYQVRRLGNFDKAEKRSYEDLQVDVKNLRSNAVIFMAHMPNVLVGYNQSKLRAAQGEEINLILKRAPKLVQGVKKYNPEVLLVPFKLAEPEMSKIEIVRWMLSLHAGLAVYSRLGDSKTYYIIDALANEIKVKKENLRAVLFEEIDRMLNAKRRRSVRRGSKKIKVKYLKEFSEFSSSFKKAFEQANEKNVMSGRWPGNFSFRCSHGFISERQSDGFVITKRNISKQDLCENDFVEVSLRLEDEKIIYWGDENAKPSIDSPVHRLLYEKIPWVNHIIHGHLLLSGPNIVSNKIKRWPCGAENEAEEIIRHAPKENPLEYWGVNIEGHGFVILIRDINPKKALNAIKKLEHKSFV